MNKRYLLLFTDFYPFPGWETYLQPEMKFLSAQFERIFIFSNHQAEGALVPELPPNVEAFFISPHISFPEKLGSLRFFFSKLLEYWLHY